MSRSRWASTEGSTPASAVMRGAGERARLEGRTGLGRLLGAVLSITRLLWVVAASATVLVFVPAPASARGERSLDAQLPATQLKQNTNRYDATGLAGRAARRTPSAATRYAVPDGKVVLAFGSGYGRTGGSPLVRRVQRRLAVVGFGPGPIDGL
jgi:hypothetical protein